MNGKPTLPNILTVSPRTTTVASETRAGATPALVSTAAVLAK
jgi:hypothetical protein